MSNSKFLNPNHGGPLHYLGNRFLSLPDISGNMHVDFSWLQDMFTILGANKKSYVRCIEPFSGSASWTIAAMEAGIAKEYIINDSDEVLVNSHRLIKDFPDKIKQTYQTLFEQFTSKDKKEVFLKAIDQYNQASHIEDKSLLLPFIINHSWGGMIFHDNANQLVYRNHEINGKEIPGFIERANLTLKEFFSEVDRVSKLFNSNKVAFESGDFNHVLQDISQNDLVILNPPYPENQTVHDGHSGMYLELYSQKSLFSKILEVINKMQALGTHYIMTYGFYDPQNEAFVLKDKTGEKTNYFRLIGYPDCAFGEALDQMYFSPNLAIPNSMKDKLASAEQMLGINDSLSKSEILNKFKAVIND